MSDLICKVDPARTANQCDQGTGIYIRAQYPDGHWDSADLAQLDAASVTAWLRSRGPVSAWACNTVLLLLGHAGDVME